MTQISVALNVAKSKLRELDLVAFLPFLILSGVALVSFEQAIASAQFVLANLISIGPFLLVSILLAAYFKASAADQLVSRVFSGRQLSMIVIATLVAALSPFCSCGVIPLIAALLSAGVPIAPVMSFWIASPLMSPEAFILTSSVISLDFALMRLVAAVAMGLFAGIVTFMAGRFYFLRSPLKQTLCGQCDSEPGREIKWRFWLDSERITEFRENALSTGLLLLKWMSIAFVLESLMLAYIPSDTIVNLLGEGSLSSILTAVVVGVPAYLNGFAAIPLIDGLLEMGMSPAVGLTFLVAGGMTSIPALIAVFALVKRAVFAWYLAVALTGAILVGISAFLIGV